MAAPRSVKDFVKCTNIYVDKSRPELSSCVSLQHLQLARGGSTCGPWGEMNQKFHSSRLQGPGRQGVCGLW